MQKNNNLINNPTKIDADQVIDLKKTIKIYPYFQTAHILLCRGLLNTNSHEYNKNLKIAAAYSSNRKKLFELITSVDKTSFRKNKNIEKKSLHFKNEDFYSFSEWLNVVNAKKIKRVKVLKNEDLIDNFINQKNDNVQSVKFFKSEEIARKSILSNENLITPTLAKVYLEQGHYNKAIKAYEKLILKYPKKSSFFAAQIEVIKKLNN